MNIIISNADDNPIYEQIYIQLKNAIIKKELQENEQLPSVRNLSKDIKVSLITVRKAYENLERDGYIYTSVGLGTYVKNLNMEQIKETVLTEIEECFRKGINLSKNISLNNDELIGIIKVLLEEEK